MRGAHDAFLPAVRRHSRLPGACVYSCGNQVARARGVSVIALTGTPASVLANHSDVVVCTPGGRFADRVQELHIKGIHILIELVEADVFQATPTGMADPARAPASGTVRQPNSSS